MYNIYFYRYIHGYILYFVLKQLEKRNLCTATMFAHSRTSEALRALPGGKTPPLSYLSNTRSPQVGIHIGT